MWQNLVFSKNKSLTDLIVNLYIAFIVMCVWLLHSSYNMLFLLKEELFPRTYIKTSNLNDYLNHFPPQGPFSLFLVSFSYRIWLTITYCVLSLYFLCLNIFWKQRKAVIFCGPFFTTFLNNEPYFITSYQTYFSILYTYSAFHVLVVPVMFYGFGS